MSLKLSLRLVCADQHNQPHGKKLESGGFHLLNAQWAKLFHGFKP
jgi:hypothetical protein